MKNKLLLLSILIFSFCGVSAENELLKKIATSGYDLSISDIVCSYDMPKDEFKIEITITNLGDVDIRFWNIGIRAYTLSNVSNFQFITALPEGITQGMSKQVSYTIKEFSKYIPHSKLEINIYDLAYIDMDESNNTKTILTYYSDVCDGYYGIYNSGIGAKTTFSVLDDDKAVTEASQLLSFSSSANSTLLKIKELNSDKIGYTTTPDFYGMDTVTYSAKGVSKNGDLVFTYGINYVYVYPSTFEDCCKVGSIAINDEKNDVLLDWYSFPNGGTNENVQNVTSHESKTLYAHVTFNASKAKRQLAFNNRIETPVRFKIANSSIESEEASVVNIFTQANQVYIEAPVSIKSIYFYNMLGVREANYVEAGNTYFETQISKAGIYMVVVILENGEKKVKKIQIP